MDTEESNTASAVTSLTVATPAPRPPGRPGACTEAALQRLVEIIRQRGLPDEAAAIRAGFSPRTLRRHLHKHPDFAFALLAAREDFRDTQHLRIDKSADVPGRTGWRAAAYLLERTFPEDYCRTGKSGAQERSLKSYEAAESRADLADLARRIDEDDAEDDEDLHDELTGENCEDGDE